MRTIDVHAHLIPEAMLQALNRGDTWHGVTGQWTSSEGRLLFGLGNRQQELTPRFSWSINQRLRDMDSLGVDMQVVSTFVGYHPFQEISVARAACREANEEVAGMARDRPQRFSGLATLPIQDVASAISELEYALGTLGLKGAMINDTAFGHSFDEPQYLPFWKAAEACGALIFFHQGGDTLVSPRSDRYHLPNTIGNLVDRAVTFATLVFGGVMDACPDLKVCFAHGGGYTCFGIGRLDRGWQVRSEARASIQRPPSTYLRRFYYDCLTHSEAALRFLIDSVGADRVVFGTDWPADMAIDWPVSWILGLESLTDEEKELILHRNLENLLGL